MPVFMLVKCVCWRVLTIQRLILYLQEHQVWTFNPEITVPTIPDGVKYTIVSIYTEVVSKYNQQIQSEYAC